MRKERVRLESILSVSEPEMVGMLKQQDEQQLKYESAKSATPAPTSGSSISPSRETTLLETPDRLSTVRTRAPKRESVRLRKQLKIDGTVLIETFEIP